MAIGIHGICPVCGSILLDHPEVRADGWDGSILLPAECRACGASWLQRFVFVGNESVETNEK